MSSERTIYEYPLAERPPLQNYHLPDVLGSGTCGVVFAGLMENEAGIRRSVAVKVLHESFADPYERDLAPRLRDEARLLSMIRHRALLVVYDLIRLNGRWAIVMERLEGMDLKKLLEQEGRLPPRAAAHLLAEIASALNAVHCAIDPDTNQPLQIVHRDLKPANIFLTSLGEPKLLDFGVAFARFDHREARTEDLCFGSFNYLSPERCKGEDLPASDVYALGVVAIECLTGPLEAALPTSLPDRLRVLKGRLHHTPGLNTALISLVESMIQTAPARRPTAAQIAAQLRDLLHTLDGPWLEEHAQTIFLHPPLCQPHPTPSTAPLSAATRTPHPDRWLMIMLAIGMLACLGVMILSTLAAVTMALFI